MKSEIEKYASQKLRDLGQILRQRDRGVVVGAVLSFIPIFPACTIGLIISAFNFFLILRGKLGKDEERLVKISMVAGCLNSILWIYILFYLGRELIPAIGYFFDALFAPFNSFGIDVLEPGGSSGLDV